MNFISFYAQNRRLRNSAFTSNDDHFHIRGELLKFVQKFARERSKTPRPKIPFNDFTSTAETRGLEHASRANIRDRKT